MILDLNTIKDCPYNVSSLLPISTFSTITTTNTNYYTTILYGLLWLDRHKNSLHLDFGTEREKNSYCGYNNPFIVATITRWWLSW